MVVKFMVIYYGEFNGGEFNGSPNGSMVVQWK